MGRFLNADALASTGQGIIGYNMYTYCAGNPINHTDVSGTKCVAVKDLCSGPPATKNQIAPTPEEQVTGIINGQATLPYSDTAIGLGSYGKSGCAYIATYNAMQLIGQPQSLGSIVSEMYNHGAVAFGAGGAGPWATEFYFLNHGIDFQGSFSGEEIVVDISEGSVITFTALYPSGWHAMTALYTNGEYNVFNRYDDSTETKIYSTLSEAYAKGWWIYGFRIDP